MKQGATRHALADRKDDLYETPAEATRALMRNVPLPKWIWEPAAGRGAIARELMSAGHRVICTDLVKHDDADEYIESGIDFLMERRPPSVQAIVTNPPYKLADEFVRHGLSLNLPVIVLLRLMAIEGTKRSDIVDGHLHEMWAGRERLPFMHRDGWDGPKNSNSGAPFAWFVFRPEKRAGPIALHRMSWRAP